ncbi:hypothetical protein MRX96_033055 [Rhipicephalus microplus]
MTFESLNNTPGIASKASTTTLGLIPRKNRATSAERPKSPPAKKPAPTGQTPTAKPMLVSPSPTAEVVSRSSAAPWDEEAPEDGVSVGCPPFRLSISFSVCCSSSNFRVDFSFCFLALANSCLSSLFSFYMFSILAARAWSAAARGRLERGCPCAEFTFVPVTMSSQVILRGPFRFPPGVAPPIFCWGSCRFSLRLLLRLRLLLVLPLLPRLFTGEGDPDLVERLMTCWYRVLDLKRLGRAPSIAPALLSDGDEVRS